MNVMFINMAGIVVIGAIVWWFWMSKPKAQRARRNLIDVLVEGGTYTPARIEVDAGKEVTLRFLRRDASPCAEKVIFEELGISAELPINEAREIVIAPVSAGEYSFTCQMRMYRGSLVAKQARQVKKQQDGSCRPE
jgi:plastocyanin domain-containing protein